MGKLWCFLSGRLHARDGSKGLSLSLQQPPPLCTTSLLSSHHLGGCWENSKVEKREEIYQCNQEKSKLAKWCGGSFTYLHSLPVCSPLRTLAILVSHLTWGESEKERMKKRACRVFVRRSFTCSWLAQNRFLQWEAWATQTALWASCQGESKEAVS